MTLRDASLQKTRVCLKKRAVLRRSQSHSEIPPATTPIRPSGAKAKNASAGGERSRGGVRHWVVGWTSTSQTGAGDEDGDRQG